MIKVGKKQLDVKAGDKVLIIGSLPQQIKIKNQGIIPDILKIPSADQIFAVIC